MDQKEKGSELLADRERLLTSLLKDDPGVIWNPSEAAAFLGCARATLADMRRNGNGPRFVVFGKTKVGYRKQALIDWSRQNEIGSTAERDTLQSGPTK